MATFGLFHSMCNKDSNLLTSFSTQRIMSHLLFVEVLFIKNVWIVNVFMIQISKSMKREIFSSVCLSHCHLLLFLIGSHLTFLYALSELFYVLIYISKYNFLFYTSGGFMVLTLLCFFFKLTWGRFLNIYKSRLVHWASMYSSPFSWMQMSSERDLYTCL